MEYLQGKHFSVTDSKDVNTVIYEINKTEKAKLKKLPKFTIERLDSIEELRNDSKDDLDKAMLNALTHTIKYLLEKGCLIDINTMKARNYLLYNNYK